MSFATLDGTPLQQVGSVQLQFTPMTTEWNGESSALLDAAKEGAVWIGYIITSDGGSHTIDTTGSSSLGWRTGAVTFANAGTTVKVGLATVDGAAGPAARPANSSGTITFDVSKSLTGGGGGITATAWQEHVPDTGTKTIANGDLVAMGIQMTARGGADAVNVLHASGIGQQVPSFTSISSAGAFANASQLPNGFITFSDGAYGWFFGSYVFLTGSTTQTWNSGSATKEYGNFIQLTYPAKCYGIVAWGLINGDCDFVIYTDPLGTPVAAKTKSVDGNTVGTTSGAGILNLLFDAPYDLAANTPYAAIVKPGASNAAIRYNRMNATAHQKVFYPANSYAISRASGAFAAINSSKDRFAVGLLLGPGDAGGAAGAFGHGNMSGGMQ